MEFRKNDIALSLGVAMERPYTLKAHHRQSPGLLRGLSLIVIFNMSLFALALPARGEIITTGSLEPADPSTWKSTMFGYVGRNGNGTMEITGGSEISGNHNYIGVESGDKGKVTVDGKGSNWNVSSRLCVGFYGHGILNITDGASVSSTNGWIGIQRDKNAIGIVTVDGEESKWTNKYLTVGRQGTGTLNIIGGASVIVENDTWMARMSRSAGSINFYYGSLITGGLLCNVNDLNGIGVINTRGLVSNVDLVFDSTHGPNQHYYLNQKEGQDITINLSLDGSAVLGAGYDGPAIITISDGVVIKSKGGYIGCQKGSIGDVLVDGDGSQWINSDFMNVGYEYGGKGTLTITNGGTVSNIRGRLYSSNGKAIVDGEGSRWFNKSLDVDAEATLKISNGGEVIVDDDTTVAHKSTAGRIHFDNGTLTTGALICDIADLTGTGTINTSGFVSDIELIFDAANGLKQTYNINGNANQNITLNLNIDGSGSLGAGYHSAGTISISDGMVVKSLSGWIAQYRGSTGKATVEGTGSKWINSGILHVANNGTGTLKISNGGQVSNTEGFIGTSSRGTVTVDGTGSKWTNSKLLHIGKNKNGILIITNGGRVNCDRSVIACNPGSTGEVTVDGPGSLLDCRRHLTIGYYGTGKLNITGGGVVTCKSSMIGKGQKKSDATGVVTVDGTGSEWKIAGDLIIGEKGSATLNITDEGFVSIARIVTIDKDMDNDSFINIASGGMLAVKGAAAASLADFLALIKGTSAIRYWDKSVMDWTDINGAENGTDYVLTYFTEGDLMGYNLLAVFTPGPIEEN
jgi:T5SS/PEP-CTERM-associated repeat protein